jgi:hypothetical protein
MIKIACDRLSHFQNIEEKHKTAFKRVFEFVRACYKHMLYCLRVCLQMCFAHVCPLTKSVYPSLICEHVFRPARSFKTTCFNSVQTCVLQLLINVKSLQRFDKLYNRLERLDTFNHYHKQRKGPKAQ